MRLTEFIPATGIIFRLGATDSKGAIDELAERLATLYGLNTNEVREGLREREQLGPTALGNEVAAPHAKMDVPHTVGVLGLSVAGIAFDAPDGAPVRIFVAFLSPRQGGRHLKALAAVGQELSDPHARSRLLAATSAQDLYAVLGSPTVPVSSAR